MTSPDHESPNRGYLNYLLRARVSRRRFVIGYGVTGAALLVSLVSSELVPGCYPYNDSSTLESSLFFKPGSFLCSIQAPPHRLVFGLLSLGLAAVGAVARRTAVTNLRNELDKFS